MFTCLHLQNFLSFQMDAVPLQHLNVVIGMNGTGKSNFVRAFEACTLRRLQQSDISYNADSAVLSLQDHEDNVVSYLQKRDDTGLSQPLQVGYVPFGIEVYDGPLRASKLWNVQMYTLLKRLYSDAVSREKLHSYLHVIAPHASFAGLAEYEKYEDFGIRTETGRTKSVLELSQGAYKFLGLMAILLDNDPNKLVVLDHFTGDLHPDVICQVADMLKNACPQVIITTHSSMLLHALSYDETTINSVLVCEMDFNGVSSLRRLNAKQDNLLDKDLGEEWASGALGGVRW